MDIHTQHLFTKPPALLPAAPIERFTRFWVHLTNAQLDQRVKNATHKLFIDCFAGGGGASTGGEQAINRPIDIAINHNQRAIDMHKRNHPFTRHYNESIWNVNPVAATFGKPVGGIWFSPDCRHFSKAKGAVPVSNSVRGLAWVVIKWAVLTKPDVIWLENVEEFQTWGPLIECEGGHKPDPDRKGETFRKWKKKLERAGYEIEHRVQSCDRWGVPTSRKRFFLVARRDGQPIVWPADTHGDEEGLLPRPSAAEHVIDWSLPCPSIFERKKALAKNTQRRIAKGLEKFVFNKAEPFIVTTNHGAGQRFRGQSINEPLSTRTKKNGEGLVVPTIARLGQTGFNGANSAYDVENPLTTITRKAEHCLVAPILERSFGTSEGADIENPVQTLTTKNKTAVVTAHLGRHKFMNAGQDIEEPLPTITGGGAAKRPAGAAHSLALHTSHLVKFRGTNVGNDMTDPLATISAGGTHHGEVRAFLQEYGLADQEHTEDVREFLIKYYGAQTEGGHSVDKPIGTVTSKARYGLVVVKGELYEIVDIGMRMLQPHELYAAHGFPKNYVFQEDIYGDKFTKAEQVAMVGNSVPPEMSRRLVLANLTAVMLSPTGGIECQ